VESKLRPEVAAVRTLEHGVDPLFVNRWSPRAMSAQPLSEAELRRIFEAGRWAPSSYNEQPWRIVYARRDTPPWAAFLDLLVPGNRAWCEKAAVLIVFLSKKTMTYNGKPNAVFAFDAGSPWMSMALQATLMGLVSHGMVGFDFTKAASLVGAGDDFQVMAMCAFGKPAAVDTLPPDFREREKPSTRRPQSETFFEGRMPG
jgi:nitroreductase